MSSLMVPVLSSLLSLAVSPAFASDESDLALNRMLDHAYTYGPQSAFVFDLDETTVDSTPRRFESMKEVIETICRVPRADCHALKSIQLSDLYAMENRYDDHELLRRAGVHDEALIKQIASDTFQVYLSGAFIVEKDRFYPGARAFLRELKKYGAKVYLVSSRSRETQFEPTFQFLMNEEVLKPGEEKFLYLKENSEESVVFKKRATAEIAAIMRSQGGKVDGIFENEPENLEVWMKNFPEAQPFFVDGAFMKPGEVSSKAIHLKDF